MKEIVNNKQRKIREKELLKRHKKMMIAIWI
jgi:hypothetical protein